MGRPAEARVGMRWHGHAAHVLIGFEPEKPSAALLRVVFTIFEMAGFSGMYSTATLESGSGRHVPVSDMDSKDPRSTSSR